MLHADRGASTFQQDYVAPDAAKHPEPLAPANFAKAASFMQRDAGGVLGEDSGLQCPDAVLFGFVHEGRQQRAAYSQAASRRRNVNAHFGNSGVDAAARYLAERRPTKNRQIVSSDEPCEAQMISIPGFPIGSVSFKGRVAGADAFEVDRSHRLPVSTLQPINCEGHG